MSDNYLKLKGTPGGIIVSYSFTYAGKFYEWADQSVPELKNYPPNDARGTLMQAAIIVLTLTLMERHSKGSGMGELYKNVSAAFAPTVQNRFHTAIKDLASFMLNLDRATLTTDAIPFLSKLAGADDKKLTESIGIWLVT